MASNTLASIAAATALAYKEIVLDRGASAPTATRFEVTLEKYVQGEPGVESQIVIRALGQGSSQANAETVALAALNAQRIKRYGVDSSNVNKGPKGGQHTVDNT